MLIRNANPTDVKASEITPPSLYLDRRAFIAAAGLAAAGAIGGALTGEAAVLTDGKLEGVQPGPFGTDEELTPLNQVTSYNNFYEFGTDKADPQRNARFFKTKPWTVEVAGAVAKPGSIGLEDLIKPHALEERVYRMRCVEAWSMVIPWVGIPLADVLKRFEPTGNAKFVAFETLHDPKQMPGQSRRVLDWPYVEGLRMDEAMHPLTILAVGVYGQSMPNQNGAPLRLVVPWKYGFKGIKSIVRINFQEQMPATSWNESAPGEYGFYSNVNPKVDHPRWSQATERRIGAFFRRETLAFNGYAEQVASLYAGMDLKKFY